MSRIPFFAALAGFCLAAMIFLGALWAILAPHEFDRRVEWVQLKLEALVPNTPHPEFVPTPLAFGETLTPTLVPTNTPPPDPTGARPGVPPLPTATRQPTRKPTTAPSAVSPRVENGGALHVALANFHHDYQRFNNCGPTTFSILLSHFGRSETQYDLAPLLKGNPDDKNVSPEEIADLARSYGLNASVRVDGTVAEMKNLLAQGIPVMVESWFVPRPKDASGHYRLLTGYDDGAAAPVRGVGLTVEYIDSYPASETGFFIAQDSYIGPNIKLPYAAWDLDWRVFNRTYLVVYSDSQAAAVQAILGNEADDATMYTHARETAQREIAANDADPFAWFNLGSALTGLKQYDQAAPAFDKARVLKLPYRMIWYQFGPYEAYYHTGRYAEMIALANTTIGNVPGLEESYYYRGLAQLALGQKDAARDSFRRAVQANPHYAQAKQALLGAGG